jgi:hypothetical protein
MTHDKFGKDYEDQILEFAEYILKRRALTDLNFRDENHIANDGKMVYKGVKMQDKFKFPTKNLSIDECLDEIKRLEDLIDDRDTDIVSLMDRAEKSEAKLWCNRKFEVNRFLEYCHYFIKSAEMYKLEQRALSYFTEAEQKELDKILKKGKLWIRAGREGVDESL